jgi:arginase family enzyme
MSDIQHFFTPIDFQTDSYAETQLGKLVNAYNADSEFPDLTDIDMAIIGVCEDRRATNNVGCSFAPDKVRDYFYSLYPGTFRPRIVDLGNITAGHEIEDTYYAVKSSIDYLIRNNVIPIIIGGSQDLTYAQFLGYEKLEQTINVVAIDSKFDLGNPDEDTTNTADLGKIILHQPNF